MKYVAGFLFTPDFRRVVLIRKNRPEWQKDKLNAVGGKVKEVLGGDEFPVEAQQREFKEETGVLFEEWQIFCKLQLPSPKNDDKIYFAVGVSELASQVGSATDETVCLVDVDSIEDGRQCMGYEMPKMEPGQHLLVWKPLGEAVYNLPWLVRMALDHVKHRNVYDVYEGLPR